MTANAGETVDSLVAIHVMGWTFVPGPEGRWYDAGVLLVATEDWSPSTDIRDSWQVLEHFQATHNIYLVTIEKRQWCCDLEGENVHVSEIADSAAMAICLASLAVHGITVAT